MLAAINITPSNFIYYAARGILNICRGVSEMVWALLFVSMVGLGPFPGVLALVIHCVGGMGKFSAEAIEAVDPRIIEATMATGANKIKVFLFSILPQFLPYYLSYLLAYWEYNTRQATILGMVGAGGIGFELISHITMFRFREASTVLLVMLFLTIVIDRISATVRAYVT
jgi:phosphonate transport system permease protein